MKIRRYGNAASRNSTASQEVTAMLAASNFATLPDSADHLFKNNAHSLRALHADMLRAWRAKRRGGRLALV